MLDAERKYCARNAARWLRDFPEKVLVVKGETLLGAYDSVAEALTAGANRVCLESFLARAAGRPAQTIAIPALALGTLHGDTLHSSYASEPSGEIELSGRPDQRFPIIRRPE